MDIRILVPSGGLSLLPTVSWTDRRRVYYGLFHSRREPQQLNDSTINDSTINDSTIQQ